MKCLECGSQGFPKSITGRGCSFCDGTEGGHGPKIAATDIETECNVPTCPDYGKSHCRNDHSVHHKHNKISVIGVYDGNDYSLFTTVAAFDAHQRKHKFGFVFHNGKFDYKTLKAHGSEITLDDYVGDTQLLGACVYNKVSDGWLATYNEKRKELNAALPSGQRHRVGTPLSLKTMAPYYLRDAKPFWENPSDHSDPEYNRTDCVHTYNLYFALLVLVDEDGTRQFYENYLLPWQKLLAEAEYEGVLIDEKALHQLYADTVRDMGCVEAEVHTAVQPFFDSYRETLIQKLTSESEQKCDSYVANRLKDESKLEGVRARYSASLQKKIEALPGKFNLASPAQMLYILTQAGIDTLVDKRDKETNEWIEKDGTDKFVLKRAKVGGNEFADLLLRFREKETEAQYLKQYINATVDGRIYCGFSIVGTRTGRLSSSGPNLQNVKSSLRGPFIVADPERYAIYTVDASQIEPRVIAYVTNDRKLIKLFQDGRDYHNYATHLFFPETRGTPEADIKTVFPELRNKVAKTGDLSLLYGTGPAGLVNMVLVRGEKEVTVHEVKQWVKDFKQGMENVLDWKKRLEDQYANGVKLKDRFGFPVQGRDGAIHMTLFNTFIQGMASRMIFHASLMATREFEKRGYDAKPLMWIHDEVVWRFPKGLALECKEIVDKYMTSYKLETPYGRVPLDIEGHIADRWTK